ncbi:hypothetical protein ACWEK5_49220 [Rhodococcus koreensis]
MTDATRSIARAVEELALALGEAGSVPRGELVRALERAAERLRGSRGTLTLPTDLVSQAEASRLVGVSRQAVNQWVRKGTIRAYSVSSGSGRHTRQVSLAEVSVTANRSVAEPFSATLRRELLAFLAAVSRLPGAEPLAASIASTLDSSEPVGLSDEGSRVLREFLIGAMGVTVSKEEFTDTGVRMLADLVPRVQVGPGSALGQLLGSLDLTVRSRDGRSGFDSASAALLGLLGAATVGTCLGGAKADLGTELAREAQGIWGSAWVERMFDAAYHMDEIEAPALTRYTAPLVYLGCNRFMRQAQIDGVSITYASSPGVLPQSYLGGPVFEELLAGRPRTGAKWQFTDSNSLGYSDKSPFRLFNFAHGLFDPSIHGIRRYCFTSGRAGEELRQFLDIIDPCHREPYLDLLTQTMAHAFEHPFAEMAIVQTSASFDWWKSHIIRASPRETLIGLRGQRARAVAHGLLVRSSALPQIVDSGNANTELRERLRLYVKNLEFPFIEERYRDDVARGVTRVAKSATETLTSTEARKRAEVEIDRLLTAGAALRGPQALSLCNEQRASALR